MAESGMSKPADDTSKLPADSCRVLFLCTQNACRSQMAELWARHLWDADCVVASAGTQPALPNPRMLQVMSEAGVEVATARSDSIELYIAQEWTLSVTLCDHAAAACPVFHGAHARRHVPFDDPAACQGNEEEVLAAFRRVREEIRAWIVELGRELGALSDTSAPGVGG